MRRIARPTTPLGQIDRIEEGADLAGAAERLSLGEAYTRLDCVGCNEAGEPYHPSTLSTMWQAAIKNLDVPQVRLHDARHTCATLMHLQGVPIALVAAWLGQPTSHSHYGPACTRSPRHSNWRRPALPADIKRQRVTRSHTRAVTSTGYL